MKKATIISLFLSCILLTCCGSQQDGDNTWSGIQAGMEDLSAITERTEYYDIVTESEPLFQWEQGKEASPLSASMSQFIGMQFYQGEPVQFWIEQNLGEYSISYDLCLYRPDGNREILLQEISASIRHCYMDQEGNCYCWTDSSILNTPGGSTETVGASLTKYLVSGEILFEKQFDYGHDITDICQTADDKIYVITLDQENGGTGSRRLAELDPSTGLISESNTIPLLDPIWGSQFLGVWKDAPITFRFHIISGNEITSIDVQNQTESSLLSFTGTSYLPPANFIPCDFRMLEDQTVEILWSALNGSRSILERLQMARVEKTPIVLRGSAGSWLTAQACSFNQSSADYHVILEDCGLGNDRDDFARLTSVQIAAGKGPDILCGSLMQDYLSGMMERGALEDLLPYMERSGIREEDYFPFAFSSWKKDNRIYGISPASPVLNGYLMDSTVLGGTTEPDIETLVDTLLSRQEDAAFLTGYDSQELLALLLAGTDTLWGMVDWEQRSCDFSGELFAKILETAKRYGDNGSGEPGSCLAQNRNFMDVFLFDGLAERERDGKTICGVLFDNGCHAAVTLNSFLAVNANSANKEGAWEFISFLMGDEAQSACTGIPAGRKAFDAWLESQKEKVSDGKEINILFSETSSRGSYAETGMITFTEADLTDAKIEEYTRTLEEAQPYPVRTAPILTIIKEEAADYFYGNKNAAQVGETVSNRVQLYLDEGR